ncbi:MMPL family transporter [Micromonospora sp. CPCC 205556]|uniref:MMPL family transporter n=1 Tax=Micromonospora sp. CPCC 205556 TaxID=3122398 RepID=UPI002FEFE472
MEAVAAQRVVAVHAVASVANLLHAAAPPGARAVVGGPTAIFADINSANNRDPSVILPVGAGLIAPILAPLLRSLLAPMWSTCHGPGRDSQHQRDRSAGDPPGPAGRAARFRPVGG